MHEQTNPYLTLFPTGQVVPSSFRAKAAHNENELGLCVSWRVGVKADKPMVVDQNGSYRSYTNLVNSVPNTFPSTGTHFLADPFYKAVHFMLYFKKQNKKWMIWLKMNTFCQRESAPSKTTTLYCKIMVSWLAATGCLRNNKTVPKNATCLLRTSCSSTPVNYYDQLGCCLNKRTCKKRFH